jgi:HK97 family phage prohead protease
LEHKALTLQLKQEKPGEFRAVFSTLNVVDKDGDVTLPGAFEKGAPVNISAWGHNWGSLPSGDGSIDEQGEEAIVEGAFYLGTPQGDTTYQTLKQRFDRGKVVQEWSYGFNVIESDFGIFDGRDVRFLKKLKVFEVSPVMVGAGENTRTLGVKGMPFLTQVDQVQAAMADLLDRSKELASLRAKEGRVLSAANRTRLSSLIESMGTAMAELRELLDATDPEKGRREVEQLFLESQRILAGIPAAS